MAVLILVGSVVLPGLASGRSSGAPSGFAGDIVSNGEPRTCTTCHDTSPLNDPSGNGSVSIDAPDTVAPGETIDITVSVVNNATAAAGGRRQGFSAIVKDVTGGGNGVFVGRYTVPDPGAVQQTNGNEAYLTHTSGSNVDTSWSFRWTAPETDMPAEVVIYAAGNAADGAGDGGDYIYTATHTLTRAAVASEPGAPPDIGLAWTSVGPRPARSTVRAQIELATPRDVAVRLLDGRGRTVRTLAEGPRAAGTSVVGVDVRVLAPGTYFLVAETDRGRRTTALNVVR